MQKIELFNESKEQLIKVLDVDMSDNRTISHLWHSLAVILSCKDKIRVYIYDSRIKEE